MALLETALGYKEPMRCDSGGSVFTIVTGGVAAKGIISGMGFTGCYVYFTDIRLSFLVCQAR